MRVLLLAIPLTLCAPALGQAGSYTDLVAFGDSLTDNGNFHALTGQPPVPYWRGRSSNGPVWVEQLASHLGLHGAAITDRAVAFATTTDVRDLQVSPWLTSVGGSADPGALYVYWAGANDLFDLLAAPGGDPQVVIGTAMKATSDALLALLASGAKHIVVANLPDLSLTPFVVELGDPSVAGSVLALTQAYNGALAQTLQALEVATGADFVELDSFSLIRRLVATPLQGGFRNVDGRALSANGAIVPDPDSHLFWDHVHPTSRGHSLVMGAALEGLGILWGDVDGNAVLDAADLKAMAGLSGACVPGTAADLDGNGRVNREDAELLRIVLRAAGIAS